MRAVMSSLLGSPEADRLRGAIGETWIELDAQIQKAGADALTEEWARVAYRHLLRAERSLDEGNVQQGWISLSAAQRAMLLNPHDQARVQRVAIVLRRELDKVGGWRAKAITDLICDDKGNLQPSLDPKGVVDAVALRDESFNTTYFKILLRRRSLIVLFVLLLIGISACLVLSAWCTLPEPLTDTSMLGAVVLFGILGASLSVAQGLLAADLSAKIPAQQLGLFVVWMRPAIGATAALVAFLLLHANETLKIFAWDTTDPVLVMVIAFVAGFSERFIVGAVERIAETGEKKDSVKK